jgi:dienelactone hydrolase
MSDLLKRTPWGDHKNRTLTGAAVSLAGFSVFLTAVLLPEMFVGKIIWLRLLLGLIFTSAATALVFGIAKLLRLVPVGLRSVLIGSCLVVTWCVYNVLSVFAILPFSTSWQITVAASLLISVASLTITAVAGAAIAAFPRTAGIIIVITAAVVAIALWIIRPTTGKDASARIRTVTAPVTLDVPYPAATGRFKVKTLYYGSGTDKHRSEYGEKADLITKSVDASPFVPKGWSVARTLYWGFDQKQLPLNGRVWFPDGKGPFPLVLIVHGAYKMTEFSDTGFAYLGALLASRGYIVASVDENFLNYGWHRYEDFEESDIDARGWLLLQHLRAWQAWNKSKKSPFFGKVDMDRIALIGHSRGGEAIAAAAAFARMVRYPRNGNIPLDFHYRIRTLIALAPSDIYQSPYERTTPAEITNVNYLLLLGTHDRQVPSIMGSRIYQRVSFSGDTGTGSHGSIVRQVNPELYIKSALYISGANHSQFNTSWGIYDLPWPYRMFADIPAQLGGDEQRKVVKIYVSAFLDATLRDEKAYMPLFRNYRLIEGWLPKTSFISRFQASTFHVVANFDEDIDPGTATIAGGKIIGQNLSDWHEQDIDYHYYLPYGSRSNRVLSVSWEAKKEAAPVLSFRLPETRVMSSKLKPTDMFVFSIACPDHQVPTDLSIELLDDAGRASRLPLSRVLSLRPPLHSYLTRMSLIEEPSPVTVLQTVSIPLSRFLDLNSSLDLRKLQQVNFRFDNTRSGSVLLDDIGFDQ